MRLSRVLAIFLAAFLLIDQSVVFAYEQSHGAMTEVATGEGTTHSPHDGGKGNDNCVHCAHGNHFQNHFIGHLPHSAASLLLPPSAATMSVLAALRIPSASIEPPYRPPRFPS